MSSTIDSEAFEQASALEENAPDSVQADRRRPIRVIQNSAAPPSGPELPRLTWVQYLAALVLGLDPVYLACCPNDKKMAVEHIQIMGATTILYCIGMTSFFLGAFFMPWYTSCPAALGLTVLWTFLIEIPLARSSWWPGLDKMRPGEKGLKVFPRILGTVTLIGLFLSSTIVVALPSDYLAFLRQENASKISLLDKQYSDAIGKNQKAIEEVYKETTEIQTKLNALDGQLVTAGNSLKEARNAVATHETNYLAEIQGNARTDGRQVKRAYAGPEARSAKAFMEKAQTEAGNLERQIGGLESQRKLIDADYKTAKAFAEKKAATYTTEVRNLRKAWADAKADLERPDMGKSMQFVLHVLRNFDEYPSAIVVTIVLALLIAILDSAFLSSVLSNHCDEYRALCEQERALNSKRIQYEQEMETRRRKARHDADMADFTLGQMAAAKERAERLSMIGGNADIRVTPFANRFQDPDVIVIQ
jgi:hypothetical protein